MQQPDEIEGIEGLEAVVAEEPDPTPQLLKEIDTTGDGVADVQVFDTTGDGYADMAEGDVDDDGVMDMQQYDTDADGKFDSGWGQENLTSIMDADVNSVDWITTNDQTLDSDRDGLTNVEEHSIGTDTLDTDTDGDAWSDRDEVSQGSDPLDWQSTESADSVAWQAEVEAGSYDTSYDAGSAYEAGAYDAGTYDAGASYDAGTSYEAGTSYDTSYDTGSTE